MRSTGQTNSLHNLPRKSPLQTSVPNEQVLESEELFEQAKMHVEARRFKEAVQAYAKSWSLNPNNYDALFYKAVANLDLGQPQNAVQDLEKLLQLCPDYRKTFLITLSIAYRRTNDF